MAEHASAHAYFNKALTFQGHRQFEKALAVYEQIIHLDPNEATFHKENGRVLEGLGWREEADQSYWKAAELLDPDGKCR